MMENHGKPRRDSAVEKKGHDQLLSLLLTHNPIYNQLLSLLPTHNQSVISYSHYTANA